MNLEEKLAILADAAKYDASCASNGSTRRDSLSSNGLGSATGTGICHSFTPDGRCVSLLKILLTNFCIFDCAYCINRGSSNVPRARFTPHEVVRLTLDFYRRNYIEGLFLSSGVIQNPDYTMTQLTEVARSLRVEHEFRGYIHLKTIPEASLAAIHEAGRWADRLSVNIELPTAAELQQLAPEKSVATIESAMETIATALEASEHERRKNVDAPAFAAAGQSTQMIIGATPTPDRLVLQRATSLYENYRLKRVYYSAFSPIPDASRNLPLQAPPLRRENRLYQADWLMRFYGFSAQELTSESQPNLPLEMDPKTGWALRNRGFFPIDINGATREQLLRVPGLGVRNVGRILTARRWGALGLKDLLRMKVPLNKVKPFVITADHHPDRGELDSDGLARRFVRSHQQLELFRPEPLDAESAVTGEL